MEKLSSIFISHGSPTLALDQCPASDFLRNLASLLPRPRAIVCASAHWVTKSPRVTGAENPETIHDFYGFPPALYEISYPASGDAALARKIAAGLDREDMPAVVDSTRGLDHGAWMPLCLAYPEAPVPVIQLSVQPHLGPRHHYRMGAALRGLKSEGVLIIGSGAVTHNLREFRGQPVDTPPKQYAIDFDAWVTSAVTENERELLMDYESSGPSASISHPTSEHFLPIFVALGAADENVSGRVLHRSFTYEVLSMSAYAWD